MWARCGWAIWSGGKDIVPDYIVEVVPPVTTLRHVKTIHSLGNTHTTPWNRLWLPFREHFSRLAPMGLGLRSSGLGEDIDSRRWDQSGFLLRWIIDNSLTCRYHMCLMSVAQLIPLNAAVRLHPVPQAQHARNGSQWVSAEAPLRTGHLQEIQPRPSHTSRLLLTGAHIRPNIVGGAKRGDLDLGGGAWVSPVISICPLVYKMDLHLSTLQKWISICLLLIYITAWCCCHKIYIRFLTAQ